MGLYYEQPLVNSFFVETYNIISSFSTREKHYAQGNFRTSACTSCARGREFEFQAVQILTLQTVRYRFNTYVSSCVALALCCGDGHCKLVTRFGVIRRV